MKLLRTFKNTCLFIAVFFLSGSILTAAGRDANSDVANRLIGLCYHDGSASIVLEEILRAEGIPYVRIENLDRLKTLNLKGLVLGEGFDSSARAVKSFMDRGGVLLSLQPGGSLAELLNLKETGIQEGGYMEVKRDSTSLVPHDVRFQLFGKAKLYEGGECLARLEPSSRAGGIICTKHGSPTAMVVAFDLATTMLTILQPKSEEVGAASDATNVEYELGEVPQVDLLRRLIVGKFLELLDVPVMRKWYFPAGHLAMLSPSGDQDWATFEQMSATMELMQELGSPYTIYLTASSQPISAEQFKTLSEGGIEFALHPDFMAGQPFSEAELAGQLKKVMADTGGKILGQRPHCCRWETCEQLPAWSEKVGLQYESILGLKLWDDKPAKSGYWVGTGLPYNMLDTQHYRRMDFLQIPVYTCDNLDFWKPDGSTLTYKPGGRPLKLSGLGLSEEEMFQMSKRIINLAMEEYHSAYGYIWHPHYLAAGKLNHPINRTDTHFRNTVNYAKSVGMGLIGNNALNEFWRAREGVSLRDVAWNSESSTADYVLSGDVKIDSLTLMAPLGFEGKKARICVNGSPREYTEANVLGGHYAMFTVDAHPEEELLISVTYE